MSTQPDPPIIDPRCGHCSRPKSEHQQVVAHVSDFSAILNTYVWLCPTSVFDARSEPKGSAMSATSLAAQIRQFLEKLDLTVTDPWLQVSNALELLEAAAPALDAAQAQPPLRCLITGHPCGTDTYEVSHGACHCANCEAWPTPSPRAIEQAWKAGYEASLAYGVHSAAKIDERWRTSATAQRLTLEARKAEPPAP